jgi:predicted CopG family antitoxin
MKKRINLTLDEDVYEGLGEIPRKVSVSELVNWLLKVFVAELKAGRELTGNELVELTNSIPGGKDFRVRLKKEFGPKLEKANHLIKEARKTFGVKKS